MLGMLRLPQKCIARLSSFFLWSKYLAMDVRACSCWHALQFKPLKIWSRHIPNFGSTKKHLSCLYHVSCLETFSIPNAGPEMVHVLVTYWRIVTGHARVHIENQRVGSHRKSFSMYGHSTFRWMVHLSNLLSEMLAHLGYGVAEDKTWAKHNSSGASKFNETPQRAGLFWNCKMAGKQKTKARNPYCLSRCWLPVATRTVLLSTSEWTGAIEVQVKMNASGFIIWGIKTCLTSSSVGISVGPSSSASLHRRKQMSIAFAMASGQDSKSEDIYHKLSTPVDPCGGFAKQGAMNSGRFRARKCKIACARICTRSPFVPENSTISFAKCGDKQIALGPTKAAPVQLLCGEFGNGNNHGQGPSWCKLPAKTNWIIFFLMLENKGIRSSHQPKIFCRIWAPKDACLGTTTFPSAWMRCWSSSDRWFTSHLWIGT